MDQTLNSITTTAVVFVFVLVTAALVGFRFFRRPPGSHASSEPGSAAENPPGALLAAPKRFRNPFWPPIHDKTSARSAATQAAVAAFFCAAVTALLAFVAYAGLPLERGTTARAFAGAAMFAVLGIGIARMSRIAALIALALYTAERIYSCVQGGLPGLLAGAVMLLLLLCFINGGRGTSAHEWFEQAPHDRPLPE